MDEIVNRPGNDKREQDIIFSRSVKAGKRIYYLDVKKNQKDEIYLSITESKKIVQGEGDDVKISFEKHKLFLYREDLEKFSAAFGEVLEYIESQVVMSEQE